MINSVISGPTRWFALLAAVGLASLPAPGAVVYETTSPYHHIRVIDEAGERTLCFDDARETKVTLADPLKGHLEYTEFFHLAWLWNMQLTNVLMIGLGGGSAQRAFEHYYPSVTVETAEIDPTVLQVARDYFFFKESPRQKVDLADGRMFLRRTKARYDYMVLDAYVQGRYGSSLPQHLATKEFFQLAAEHLTTNGLLAYNVIGTAGGYRANIVGSIYRTLKTVFPQVYWFEAKTSWNIVLVATRASARSDMNTLRQRAGVLVQTRRVTVPGFRERLESIHMAPPPNAGLCPVLTDDFAPVEGLAGSDAQEQGAEKAPRKR